MDKDNQTLSTPILSQEPLGTDMSVNDWVFAELLMWVPLVNLICMCVWAFGSSPLKPSRKKWAKARLIVLIISSLLSILLLVSLLTVLPHDA